MTLRKAAQQALEALRAMQSYAAAERKGLRICDEAITALKAALEQEQEQEPVSWITDPLNWYERYSEQVQKMTRIAQPEHGYVVPLYAHPPRRDWQGLTDEEIDALKGNVWGSSGIAPRSASAFARAVEAAMKEKNHD
jgi:phage-related minor tail protein